MHVFAHVQCAYAYDSVHVRVGLHMRTYLCDCVCARARTNLVLIIGVFVRRHYGERMSSLLPFIRYCGH